MRYAFVVLLILAVSAACWSAILPDDAGLDKPVTLAVKGESISDIMSMLADQTGVRLRASKDIEDQKATIFIDGKPLREVMEGLSQVFGYFWSTKKYSTGTVYEIWQDEKSRQALLNQRQKALDAAWQAALRDIDFKARAAGMSTQELTALRAEVESGLAKDTVQSSEHLKAISQMEKDPLQGICARLIAELPGNLRSLLKPGVSLRFDARSKEPEWAVPDSIRKIVVGCLNNSGSPDRVVLFGNADAGAIELDPDSVSINIVVRTQGATLQLTATATAAGVGGTMSFPRVRAVQLSQQVIGLQITPNDLPRSGDTALLAVKAGISAVDLAKEVEAYPGGTTGGMLNRSDVLSLLHRKTGVQIIADHYSYWTTWPIGEHTSALDILSSLATPGLNERNRVQMADWGWDDRFVYVRARDILSADCAEVPNRHLRYWAAVSKEKGCLGLDEHADIATLSDEQIMALRLFGQYLGIGNQIPFTVSHQLRLFGTLSRTQRQEALSGGTSVDAFTPEQKRALTKAFFRPANSFIVSSKPMGDAQVGIWTTEPPTMRLDQAQSAPEFEQNPEPPSTMAVTEGSSQGIPSELVAVLQKGGFVDKGSGQTSGGSGSDGVITRFSSADGRQYTMVFTFVDGRAHQTSFFVPKCESQTSPGAASQ